MDAKEFEADKMYEMVDYAYEHFIEQLLGSLNSPCIIYTDTQVRYSNQAFKNIADEKDINDLFDARDGYLSNLSEYSEDNLGKNKVIVSLANGKKFYKVMRNNVNIDHVVQISKIYIFTDITLEEYQKVKIKSYTEILESLVFKTKYHREELNTKTQEQYEEVEKNEEVRSTQKLVINDNENAILRRSHTHKTTALEYIEELDDETLSELQELDELDQEFSDSINMLGEDSDVAGIKKMAEQLQKYANEINLLFEFKDLAYAIESLSTLFFNIDETKLNEKNLKKILIMLDGIKDDLATWRKVVFIDQDAVDIHYLDSSLFSSCLKIELMLSDDSIEIQEQEDDFVLF